MKLATLHNDTRDGALLVVSHDLSHAVKPFEISAHLPEQLRRSWIVGASINQS